MAYKDIVKHLLKSAAGGTKFAAKNLDQIDNIFSNKKARTQLVEFLKAGDGNVDNFLKNSDLDKNIVKALKESDEIAVILKKTSNIIGKHGDTLESVAKHLEKGGFKNADELTNYVKNQGIKEGDDLYKAFSKSADDLVRNSKTLGNLNDANQFLRNAVSGGKAVGKAAEKTWDFTKKGFTSPRYQRKASNGMENLSRSQVEGFKKSGHFDEMIKNSELIEVRQFSKLRTGLTVGGLLGTNSLTDGMVSDGAVTLVTSSKSPVFWVGKLVFDGGVEAVHSVVGDSKPDFSTPEWLDLTEDYDPDRDGHVILVTGEDHLASPEAYKERYNALADKEHMEMSGAMTPEVYAQKYPAFLSAKLHYDANKAHTGADAEAEEEQTNDVAVNIAAGAGAGSMAIDWDNLKGGQLTNAFETASNLLEKGDLKLGFMDKLGFGLVSGLANLFNSIGLESIANNFRKFAVDLAKDEIETQFGNRFQGMMTRQPAPTAGAPALG